jgi:hypothetical protein
MRKRLITLVFFCLLLGCASRWAANKDTGEGGPPSAAANSANSQEASKVTYEKNSTVNARPVASAGRKVFVDPITGEIVPQPGQRPAMPLPPQAENAQSTSGDGLRETPGTTRGGGVKINLQGRFRSSAVAAVGPDGKLTTRCVAQPDSQSSEPMP